MATNKFFLFAILKSNLLKRNIIIIKEKVRRFTEEIFKISAKKRAVQINTMIFLKFIRLKLLNIFLLFK